jgi:glutathione S-transferase
MRYTLYAAPGSCSLAPHIILEEIGEPYDLSLMSPGHPETKTEAFRQVNPKGRIPVLTAAQFHLTEAPAILLHLASAYPDKGLLDPDGESIVRATEWFNWLSGTVHAVAVRMIWRPDYFSDDPSGHPAIVAKGRQHLLAAFSFIDAKLSKQEWAIRNTYSVVDPYLLVFFRWGNRMSIDMRALYPAWTEHALHLEQRPAVQRALVQESISLWQ